MSCSDLIVVDIFVGMITVISNLLFVANEWPISMVMMVIGVVVLVVAVVASFVVGFIVGRKRSVSPQLNKSAVISVRQRTEHFITVFIMLRHRVRCYSVLRLSTTNY